MRAVQYVRGKRNVAYNGVFICLAAMWLLFR